MESADLMVRDGKVFMRTTTGPKRVDVIYRRIDAYLDPLAFDPTSLIGVPGLSAYLFRRCCTDQCHYTGVADDKSIYPYVPMMIRFYLDEEPIPQLLSFQPGSVVCRMIYAMFWNIWMN